MNKFLATLALLVAMAMPAFAQQAGRLSPDDQREFDKYCTKWVNDTQSDRDDIAKNVKHMQELMGRNGIPSNVHYAQIANTGNEYPAALINASEVRIALTSFLQYEPMKLAAIFSAPSLTYAF